MAAAWALVWAPLFTLVGIVYGVEQAFELHRWVPLLVEPIAGSLIGLLTGWFYGIGFGGLLWLFERGRSLAALPAWRVAAWGAIPGLAMGNLFFWPTRTTLICGLLGAGTASAMLRLALRDAKRQQGVAQVGTR